MPGSELGARGRRQGTPSICSTSEPLLWYSLELDHARDREMAKMA